MISFKVGGKTLDNGKVSYFRGRNDYSHHQSRIGSVSQFLVYRNLLSATGNETENTTTIKALQTRHSWSSAPEEKECKTNDFKDFSNISHAS